VFVKACQKQAKAEKRQVRKIVPLLPNQLLKGTVNQHPIKEQHRYGAELTSPRSQLSLEFEESPIPNCLL